MTSPPIPSGRAADRPRSRRALALNIALPVLAILVAVLAYALVRRHLLQPPVETERADGGAGVIQVDVLNGCGTSGAAQDFTSFLRARGYDVVEIRNYKTFDLAESLVIDRVGDTKTAERVAYALGIARENVVQQLNPDYYVDVTVVVGRDYPSLKPSR
jgi:hypothetical protein